MTLLLAVLVLLFAYPFVIYPAILYFFVRSKPHMSSESAATPSVALIICALNEQRIIREKIQNCLALRYPREKLTIIVISDGSTDQTAQIAREFETQGVLLKEGLVRKGKISNLNEVIPTRTEDIIVLSDANVLYHPDAISRLVTEFQDPAVGCVSGKVILTDTTPDLDQATDQYYALEWLLQERSSEVYSMAGADGAMYAFRTKLFRPCPADTLIEDFVIPMQIIASGHRVIFAPAAKGWEKGVESLQEEFRRKVRIAAGAAQGLLRGNAWPRNAPPRFWFIFISHKLLRWLSPVVGFIIIAVAFAGLPEFTSLAALYAVAAVIVLAGIRLLTGWNHSLVSASFYFLFGQIAMAIGLLKGITGQQTVLWTKANR